ncbi:MAG: hypothetical protein SFT81_04325 [Candidatus Caenarcaniphilales bacterium]|nr:hypothetical protein [Candidatus Caenarcaniphilales bacterium]
MNDLLALFEAASHDLEAADELPRASDEVTARRIELITRAKGHIQEIETRLDAVMKLINQPTEVMEKTRGRINIQKNYKDLKAKIEQRINEITHKTNVDSRTDTHSSGLPRPDLIDDELGNTSASPSVYEVAWLANQLRIITEVYIQNPKDRQLELSRLEHKARRLDSEFSQILRELKGGIHLDGYYAKVHELNYRLPDEFRPNRTFGALGTDLSLGKPEDELNLPLNLTNDGMKTFLEKIFRISL